MTTYDTVKSLELPANSFIQYLKKLQTMGKFLDVQEGAKQQEATVQEMKDRLMAS